MELRQIVLHVLTECKREQVDALPLDDLTRSFVQLLTAGSDPNSANPRGKTCLHHIASHWDKDNRSSNLNVWVRYLLQSLIQAGADVNKRDEQGRPSLHYAAMEANVEMVRTLLSAGAEADLADEKNNTPLLLAMGDSKKFRSNAMILDIAQQLIDAGAHVNAANIKDGMTVLHYACDRGDEKIVDLLLSRGASPTDADKFGFNALLHAVKSDHMEIVRILIDKGSDVNYIVGEKSDTPMTALHYAISNDNVEMLEYLLEHGADPNRLKSLGKSILIYVLTEPKLIGERHHILQLLLSHKADLLADDLSNAKSLFELLVLEGSVPEIQVLVGNGFDIGRFSPQAPEDFSPLHKCLQRASMTPVYDRLLVWLECDKKRSLDLNHIDASGKTPLTLAAGRGLPECVRLLIEWGANVEHIDSRGRSPLEVAAAASHRSLRKSTGMNFLCIRVLAEAGAKLESILSKLVLEPPIAYAGVELLMAPNLRQITQSLEKAQFIVKCRTLDESIRNITQPSELIGKYLPFQLRDHYNGCKCEIGLLKNTEFYNSLTYHDVLADKKLYRRVREDQVYEAFDMKKVKSRFPLYGQDLCEHFKDMKIMHEIWENSVINLGFHVGLDHDTYYLIIENILKRLRYENLCSVAKSR